MGSWIDPQIREEIVSYEQLSGWQLSSSGAQEALAVVDGLGPWAGHGPHYSRRSPGSRTFTGVGREVVLYHPDGAVWAVVLHRCPAPRGAGLRRHTVRDGHGVADVADGRWLWRNVMFRNLGAGLSSDLIRTATALTVLHWTERYGYPPPLDMRTEVDVRRVRSTNPGYCYQRAGWRRGPTVRGKLHLFAPRWW